MNLPRPTSPPPMPEIQSARIYIDDAAAAIERARAAWHETQLRDAINSAKGFIAAAETALGKPQKSKPRRGGDHEMGCSAPVRPRMPLYFFIGVVIMIIVGAVLSSHACAAELEYDARAAQQEQIFKLLTWQTINCMSAGAMNQIRQGERDPVKLAVWLSDTCGGPLTSYTVNEMKIEPKRVRRLLLAMAADEISRVPGVTLKKP